MSVGASCGALLSPGTQHLHRCSYTHMRAAQRQSPCRAPLQLHRDENPPVFMAAKCICPPSIVGARPERREAHFQRMSTPDRTASAEAGPAAVADRQNPRKTSAPERSKWLIMNRRHTCTSRADRGPLEDSLGCRMSRPQATAVSVSSPMSNAQNLEPNSRTGRGAALDAVARARPPTFEGRRHHALLHLEQASQRTSDSTSLAELFPIDCHRCAG